jgi:hypothetical protein
VSSAVTGAAGGALGALLVWRPAAKAWQEERKLSRAGDLAQATPRES